MQDKMQLRVSFPFQAEAAVHAPSRDSAAACGNPKQSAAGLNHPPF